MTTKNGDEKIVVFWFRRDLRLDDNPALNAALKSGSKVLPLFIFDEHILHRLPTEDARLDFIHQCISSINNELKKYNSGLCTLSGKPEEVWPRLLQDYNIAAVYFNKDYEPYGIDRDKKVTALLNDHGIEVKPFKDHLIFEEHEVVKSDGKPYTVFTPYKKAWLSRFANENVRIEGFPKKFTFVERSFEICSLSKLGFKPVSQKVLPYQLDDIGNYANQRDFPSKNGTTYLSPHLRFGTISIRKLVLRVAKESETLLSELIWREFFMQILFHFPHVAEGNFRSKYNGIQWLNNEEHFELWCAGKTGYPMVDAGMRELNETGYMHNRVRMVTASFLCKHLLIDWRWGEAYFAEKLLDFELSSNNGNWQWAAGTGCDAAPYFRVFNPTLQAERFDPNNEYIKKWVPEFQDKAYQPIVEHSSARKRAIDCYKSGIID
jgi:deoxyribodipyrimidine photo-lyase